MRYLGLALNGEENLTMLGTVAKDMARKKTVEPQPVPQPDDRDRKPMAVQIRASAEWKNWVERLSKYDERSVAILVERALREYAERAGFPEAPPKR